MTQQKCDKKLHATPAWRKHADRSVIQLWNSVQLQYFGRSKSIYGQSHAGLLLWQPEPSRETLTVSGGGPKNIEVCQFQNL